MLKLKETSGGKKERDILLDPPSWFTKVDNEGAANVLVEKLKEKEKRKEFVSFY